MVKTIDQNFIEYILLSVGILFDFYGYYITKKWLNYLSKQKVVEPAVNILINRRKEKNN